MSSDLIFHDLLSQKWPLTWSPFTIRTLLTLNHLSLTYTHKPTSYPDIADLLKSRSVTPATKGIPYTLPAITTDGKTIMDSDEIAYHLASTSEEHAKKLFPQGQKSRDAVKSFDAKVWKSVLMDQKLWRHLLPFVPAFLDDRGAEYFETTRGQWFGDLEKLRKEVRAEEADNGLKEAIKEAGKVILEWYEGIEKDGEVKKDAVFLYGAEKPQYADFLVVALVQWWVFTRGEEVVMGALQKVENGRIAKIVRGCEALLKPKEE